MTIKNVKRIGPVFLLVLGLAMYMDASGGELHDGIFIERNDAGEGEKDLTLELYATDLKEEFEYKVEISEVLFTEEEAHLIMEKAESEIDKDFSKITNRIPMKKSYQDGLVEVTWKFDPADCMDMEGNVVKEQIPNEGLVVNAEAYLECQNYDMTYCFAFVIPKQEISDSEQLLSGISSYLEEEMKKEGEKRVELPTEINGFSLRWKEKEEHLAVKILFLEILVVFLLLLSNVEKKKEAEKKKMESLNLDYPEIVGQMTILLGAGMTIPQAWNKIALRYLDKIEKGVVAKRPAYEELVLANRCIREGGSEREALTLFGKQIPLKSYHRFIRILLNGKSKGGRDLCRDLEQETTEAYRQRVLLAKQKGEEASTKMLLPLMLMMILVMAIVMLPALIEFAG